MTEPNRQNQQPVIPTRENSIEFAPAGNGLLLRTPDITPEDAALKRAAAEIFLRDLDTNHDGRLSQEELDRGLQLTNILDAQVAVTHAALVDYNAQVGNLPSLRRSGVVLDNETLFNRETLAVMMGTVASLRGLRRDEIDPIIDRVLPNGVADVTLVSEAQAHPSPNCLPINGKLLVTADRGQRT